jgi:hypothetical protein
MDMEVPFRLALLLILPPERGCGNVFRPEVFSASARAREKDLTQREQRSTEATEETRGEVSFAEDKVGACFL